MQEPPSIKPDFSYDALNKHFDSTGTWLDDNDYMVSILPTNKQFIAFFKKVEPTGECAEGKIFKTHGLKFHISLPEYDSTMFKRGWDIVRDTLMSHQVASFKVIRAPHKMSDTPGQEGKDVTVYIDAEPGRTLAEWQTILENVTRNLVNSGVSPGYRSPGTQEKPEAPINGSNYVTYRYFNEKSKKSIWPQPDPCQQIKVAISQPQPPIPKLEKAKEPTLEKTRPTL